MNTDSQKNFKDMILAVLDAIDFSEDKEKFTQQFITNTQMQAFLDLIDTLAEDKQKQITEQININKDDQQKIIETINAFFTQAQTQKALEIAAEKQMTGWIKAIAPTLSTAQKSKLNQLRQSLLTQNS